MESENKAKIKVQKTEDFDISGDGSAPNWEQTGWVTLPQRRGEPDQEGLSTKLKMLYSGSGIYFLFSCEDKILNATMDADFMKLWKEDVVEVFLWPDEKSPVYFEYELSPLNYELPLLISNENGDLARWQPFMYEEDRQTRHKTAIQGGEKQSGASIDKWIAEFFIPYKLLRPLNNIHPEPGTQWRANFYRVDYDGEGASWTWQPTKESFHEYRKFGTLQFE